MSTAQALANEHADICAENRLEIRDGAVWDGDRRLFDVGYPESGHTLRRMIEAFRAGEENAKEDCSIELEEARTGPWPEWAEKLLRIMEEFGAEYEADDEINLPDELAEWLHNYASDLKLAAQTARPKQAGSAEKG